MGIYCGPLLKQRQLPPETLDEPDEPSVARCSTCRQGYTGASYQDCPQEENHTICLVPGCRGEVFFI